MKPAFSITADSKDVTARLRGNLKSLRLTDKVGLEADELELTLADHDGGLILPRRGVILGLAIGWSGGPRIDKGTFSVDEIGHSGPPDVVTIRARSVAFQGPIKCQREQAYDATTLGDILTTLAARNNLVPAIENRLAQTPIPHIDQTNESDANFLTRLGQDYDAIATISDGRLLFIPAGHPSSLGGAPLPTVVMTRAETDTHTFSITDRGGSHSGVRAKWRRIGSGETRYAIAGETEDGKAEGLKTLKRDYPSQIEAQAAADAEFKRLQRGQTEIGLTLPVGRPEIIPNLPLRLQGWRPEIDNEKWLTGEVTHQIDDSGFTTAVAAQTQAG